MAATKQVDVSQKENKKGSASENKWVIPSSNWPAERFKLYIAWKNSAQHQGSHYLDYVSLFANSDVKGEDKSSLDLANLFINTHGPIVKMPEYVFKAPERQCLVCGKHQSKLLKCSRCSSVLYCSSECQVQDWKDERPLPNGDKGTYVSHKEACPFVKMAMSQDVQINQVPFLTAPVLLVHTAMSVDMIAKNLMSDRNNYHTIEQARQADMDDIKKTGATKILDLPRTRELLACTLLVEWTEVNLAPCTLVWMCTGKSEEYTDSQVVTSRISAIDPTSSPFLCALCPLSDKTTPPRPCVLCPRCGMKSCCKKCGESQAIHKEGCDFAAAHLISFVSERVHCLRGPLFAPSVLSVSASV